MKLKQYLIGLAVIGNLGTAAYAAPVPTGPDLITNGGFETGDLTGYTANGSNFVSPASGILVPHTGNFFLIGGNSGSLASVSQTITTTIGKQYQLTYFFASDGQTTNQFRVTAGAATLFNQTDIAAQGYAAYTFNFTATGASTVLSFDLRDDPGGLSLDDISLFLLSGGGNFVGTPGLSPNQSSVASGVDRLSTSANPNAVALVAALTALPATALPTAFDQLSPEAFGRFSSITAFNNASFETEAMDNYLAGQRCANGNFIAGQGGIDSSGLSINDPSYDPALAMVHSRMLAWNPGPFNGTVSDVASPRLGGVDLRDSKDMKSVSGPAYSDPWNFFVRGNVILAQGFSQDDVSHFDGNTASVVLGTDYRITPNFLVGLTAGYGHTDVTLDNNGSSATVDSYSPGVYASYACKGWFANLTGSYVHNAYTQDRRVEFLGQTASSAPEGNEGVVNLDGGYEFHHGAFTYGPILGVQYTHLTVDGYRETGSVADLSVNEQQADSLRSRFGGRVGYAYSHSGVLFTPHMDVSWQHECMDGARGITSQFDGAGLGSFSVRTAEPTRDFALVNVGLDAEINRTITTFANYTAQAGQDNYFGQSVQAGVKVGF